MVEISIPVEISTKNPQIKVFKIAKNRYLRPKNPIFRRIHIPYVQYLGKGFKWSKNTFPNLRIMKIGRIGRFIQNWKFMIFQILGQNSPIFPIPKVDRFSNITVLGGLMLVSGSQHFRVSAFIDISWLWPIWTILFDFGKMTILGYGAIW